MSTFLYSFKCLDNPQANKSGQPQNMSGSKEDVNVVPDDSENDINNNYNSQSDTVNVQNEGGDVLIIGGSDNESDVDEEERGRLCVSKTTTQEVLLFALTFCSAKFDYLRIQFYMV